MTRGQVERLRREGRASRNRLALAIEIESTTQVKLADAIGLTQPYISKLANGQYDDIPLETSRALADFFGCSIEDLFPAKAEVA
jgi:DNA-binding XRE family transcriptional regulator